VASTVNNRPGQYRAKAQANRDAAESEPDEAKRKALLQDADLWERMAAYEEQNPTHAFPAYYPKP